MDGKRQGNIVVLSLMTARDLNYFNHEKFPEVVCGGGGEILQARTVSEDSNAVEVVECAQDDLDRVVAERDLIFDSHTHQVV